MSKKQIVRVFVVDDEQVIAKTLAIILQQSGFSASFFTDPLEALTVARSDAPDLLISDVMMPRLSGVDLAIRMKEQCPKCKILLFSGCADTVDLLVTAREQGHNFHLLSKPVHPTDLLREIKEQTAAKKTAAYALGIAPVGHRPKSERFLPLAPCSDGNIETHLIGSKGGSIDGNPPLKKVGA
jgi:FixJ family two-component response regulator